MHLKRFRQPTVREALAAVKRELGPDALVVSTSLVPMRGWRRLTGRREVEVTAAFPAALSESRPAALPTPVADEPERGDELVARLLAAGLDGALAREVAAAVPHRDRRSLTPTALRAALAGRLGSLAAGGETHAAIEVFVGPPGGGKTTTIAKIAARAHARRGPRRALVAADGYRVGAVEQLRLYADILAAPFAVVRTPQDLDAALLSCRRPALVDTAGRSPNDRGIRDLYDALTGRAGVRTHLVIPAATTPRDAARIFDRYDAARPDRVVITKVDEAESFAPLVRVLRERNVPLSYLGTGQRVPDDLAEATATALAGTILGDVASLSQEIA